MKINQWWFNFCGRYFFGDVVLLLLLIIVGFGGGALGLWGNTATAETWKEKADTEPIPVKEYKLEGGLVAKTFKINGSCYMFVSGLEKGGLTTIKCSQR